MYIDEIPNRKSPPAILLRESYRENGKTKKRTLANLSCLPTGVVEGLKILLKGGIAVSSAEEALVIERSLPHGHVAAVLGMARACGAEGWFKRAPAQMRSILLALLVARIISPGSKLSTYQSLQEASATHSLSAVLGLEKVALKELYKALDWLSQAQETIEKTLTKKHVTGTSLLLYDMTSTWVTGNCCQLAAHGYSRDGKKDEPQIVFGLICSSEGCPIAVEVFSGNTADSSTLAPQVTKLKERYGIENIAWVADRGMITQSRINDLLRPSRIDWISSLRAQQIRKLAQEKGPFQPSLFDERNFMEFTSEEFPGERLIVCHNPFVAKERADNRETLLKATEKELDKIIQATQRTLKPLKGEKAIALRVGHVINHYKMEKHFDIEITNSSFSYKRNEKGISNEAALDGYYVIRTSLSEENTSAQAAIAAYKNLSSVERAFRSLKTVDLEVRPLFHWKSNRVRAHVFLCMLAYYIQWHMREKLKPMLFDDEHLEEKHENGSSPVTQAQRSSEAKTKDASKQSADGLPVLSFRLLLKHLATLSLNICHIPLSPNNPNTKIFTTTRPTFLQEKAASLLNINLSCTQ